MIARLCAGKLMRIIIASVLIISIFQMLPARAEVVYSHGGGNPNDPELLLQTFPWMHEVRRKIKEHRDYKRLTNKFISASRENDMLTCVFEVDARGKIVNPTVYFDSGSAEASTNLVDFLKKLKRLAPPPNQLPVERGLQVCLLNVKNRAIGFGCDIQSK